jgi:phosphoglycolate phosphatase
VSLTTRPRAILFDWDNTLVDSWGTIHHALNVMLEAMGHPVWTMEETRERVRHSLRDTFPRMFGERWQEAQRLYLDAFTAVHLERLTPLFGAAELVERLCADGFYLGIVSNKTGPVLRREAEKLGWSPHFGRVVGATDAASDKPHRAVVDLALQGSGIEAGEEVWFVGDTGIDMECALNAGCLPVLVGGEGPEAAEFAKYRPRLHFTDCSSLYRFVQGL